MTKAWVLAALLLLFFSASVLEYEQWIPEGQHTSTSASSSVLNLSLSLNATSIQPGHGIAYAADLLNTLGNVVNVPAATDWQFPALVKPFCGQPIRPMSVGVIQGSYGSENLSQAPGPEYPIMYCTVQDEGGKNYAFQPHSDVAFTTGCYPPRSNCNITASSNGLFTGNWQGGMVPVFTPGRYTVVAEDEWGHLSLAHFDVVLSLP